MLQLYSVIKLQVGLHTTSELRCLLNKLLFYLAACQRQNIGVNRFSLRHENKLTCLLTYLLTY